MKRLKTACLSLLLFAGCAINGEVAHDMADNDACVSPGVWRYEQPGCHATPICGSPAMDMCFHAVCSCNGKVIAGCDYYSEPWTLLADPTKYQVGDNCP